MTDRVLVTGITGFIAAHVAQRLLEKGYQVRGTLRNADKGARLLDRLANIGLDISKIELVEANLAADAGWRDAVQDCRFIQHIASPLPLEDPLERESLVPEARVGAQRILEHGLSAGAQRIVMTSSMAAMMGQKGRRGEVMLTEDDWSDPEWTALRAYTVSKTRAELSAWAYVKAQNLEERLTTICPGFVLGPDSFDNGGTSVKLIRSMFSGDFPVLPKIAYPIIDVRDCAAIHVSAMDKPKAAGRRLVAGADSLWFKDIADILREAYPVARYPQAEKLPRRTLPNYAVKFLSLFEDRLKTIAPDLGIFHRVDSSYVSSITGVIPRPAKEAVLATARSIVPE